MNYVVVGIVFPPTTKAPSAKRILNRLGITPGQHGGRRSDGYLQYFLVEPTIAKNRTEVPFGDGGMKLIIGIPK